MEQIDTPDLCCQKLPFLMYFFLDTNTFVVLCYPLGYPLGLGLIQDFFTPPVLGYNSSISEI